jgi:hypothetical protein
MIRASSTCPFGKRANFSRRDRGGQTIGETDEIGLRAVVNPYQPKHLHATILQALGLGCDDLYFEIAGRQERLTGIAGSSPAISGVLS